ncbi:AGE family epimerase/isomerase [Sphingomonas echinoides]|uniref:AGE family epimerase/isomerase n=1 Tax=Sphingomonas echinoides TaxID=59803 RepID=A0ABU4PTS9_9SPHN|nr:AGE family epimerase/isomerase [Sphingomonas echinoides]MDX5986617.1 AGE family epimerase/isomerase [Sphingomonas echinoides]
MNDARARFAVRYKATEAWLFDKALPLWSTIGVDRAGGFFEKIGQDGQPVEEPRRTRVIARQLYSFAAAARMGWQGDTAALVRHAFAALLPACCGTSGLVIAKTQADGKPIDTRYDFYDHAFALFALANAATMAEHRDRALATAHAMQDAMESVMRHPQHGFMETDSGDGPLRANPHMHMLEACLALAGVDRDCLRWQRLADEIVNLALTRFIDPDTGALREVFASDWRALTDAEGQIVEPGHQFEWAWLLSAWNAIPRDGAVARAAERMASIGLDHGIAPTGLVIDALTADLAPKGMAARVWPQCERLKSHVERALSAEDDVAVARWWNVASEALEGWAPFLATSRDGLWFDRLNAEGCAIDQPAPASTLYHLVCGLETAQAALANRPAAAVLSLNGAAFT